MRKRTLVSLVMLAVLAVPAAFAQAATGAASPSTIKYIAAAAAVGLATIGGGIAVGQIGAAAMAAMSENPELSGRALPYVGLGEGICLWGFIVALMILSSWGAAVEFFVIGEEEVVLGFRFAGVDGAAVANREEAREAFRRATESGDVMVLILTEQVSAMIEEEVTAWQFGGSYPLVVEVPGIEGHLENRRSLVDAIREAVGVHV